MIINPLQRIIVTKSDRICRPGSLGYLMWLEPVYSYNAWSATIVFSRFGRSGKPRVGVLTVATKMFRYEEFSKQDQAILEVVKVAEGLEPRIDPYRGRRAVKTGGTDFEATEPESKNLLKISDLEFLAYILAFSLYLRELSLYEYELRKAKRQNAEKRNYFHHFRKNARRRSDTASDYRLSREETTVFLSNECDLEVLTPERIGPAILKCFGSAKLASFRSLLCARVSNPKNRVAVLNRLMRQMCLMSATIVEYKSSLGVIHQKTEMNIRNIIRHYKTHKGDLEVIQEGMNSSKRKNVADFKYKGYMKRDYCIADQGTGGYSNTLPWSSGNDDAVSASGTHDTPIIYRPYINSTSTGTDNSNS